MHLDFQFLSHQLHDGGVGFAGCAAGINQVNPMGLAAGDRQVGMAHSAEEPSALLLKTVFVFGVAATFVGLKAIAERRATAVGLA